MNWNALQQLIQEGESETVEFKRSTAQLRRAMETLCGMLNGAGGRVVIGVTPQGRIVGQQISDSTLREVADALRHFEPPATIAQTRIDIGAGKEVLVLEANPNPELRPEASRGALASQKLGLVSSSGHGRGAAWSLVRHEHENE